MPRKNFPKVRSDLGKRGKEEARYSPWRKGGKITLKSFGGGSIWSSNRHPPLFPFLYLNPSGIPLEIHRSSPIVNNPVSSGLTWGGTFNGTFCDGRCINERVARVSTPSVRKEFSLQVRRIVRLANCSLVRLLIRLKRFLFLRSPVQGSFR